jgi:hypothetical protein
MYIGNNDVFWFDISMSNIVVMQVLNGLSYLLDDRCSLCFRQYFVLLELGVESALLHVFQDDV